MYFYDRLSAYVENCDLSFGIKNFVYEIEVWIVYLKLSFFYSILLLVLFCGPISSLSSYASLWYFVFPLIIACILLCTHIFGSISHGGVCLVLLAY